MNNKGKQERIIHITEGKVRLEGSLEIPEGTKGIVLFAHGSGSSRHSTRNNYVAKVLRRQGLGTLLLDLLTPEEDAAYETRFDIDLLVRRLLAATLYLKEEERTQDLPLGYFGASTGAAAAIQAAAMQESKIGAIVSRGGRPDLAGPYLDKIESPILLIVGGNDDVVIDLNETAYKRISAIKQLKIIPGATHLFEEHGALEKVAILAAEWFGRHLIGE